MNLVIVPNSLRDEIDAAIDKALDGRPATAWDRAAIFGKLLDYFDEHGCIPDFTLEAKTEDKPCPE